MGRLNKSEKTDVDSLLTLSRAQQYMTAAKTAYPSETLKSLASLQQSHIYHTADGELRGAIEMSPADLNHCLQKCRQLDFANCDMQALEVALQLRHGPGISDFSIVSNHKLSHNYGGIHPCTEFPKGAIADSWTGQGLQELNLKTKLKFQHKDQNYTINSNMHAWIEHYGARHFGG
ncbi:type III effector [Ralstonia sp. A12]|uniref:hypothetical protein n=1 Tax=Ralstonia sp. A12 TaxID=1217052 RepID=UPI000575DAAD|nr:hypothetical protein [Ralstonia sp. A12]KHK52092.1 type III effector [Ralstonia sp. A12]